LDVGPVFAEWQCGQSGFLTLQDVTLSVVTTMEMAVMTAAE
jgi:hypothetical protein